MDCFYNAYIAHIHHLGLTPSSGSKEIFNAMRSSILPEYKWSVQTELPLIDGKKKEEVVSKVVPVKGDNKKRRKKKRRRWRSGNKHIKLGLDWSEGRPVERIVENDDSDEDILSDANGFVNGRPWWEEFDDDADYIFGQLFDAEDDTKSGSKANAVATPNPMLAPNENGWRKQGKGLVRESSNPWWRSEHYGYGGGYGYNPYNPSGYRAMRFGLTPASVAPWIARALAKLDGVNVKIEYVSWWNKNTYLQEAESDAEKRVILSTDYGKEVNNPQDLTLAPAIYCMVSSKHAQFGTSVPSHGVCCMAIQLSVNTNVYTPIQKGE